MADHPSQMIDRDKTRKSLRFMCELQFAPHRKFSKLETVDAVVQVLFAI